MKTVLIISSFVSASIVGATASAFCLRRLGIDAVILPTTLMGRHPGWGSPGGGATQTDQFEAMWDGIKAQNIKFDAVLTGYMGDRAHITLSEIIIQHVKRLNSDALVLVDPVMGDNGALYIPEDRAQAIAERLIPLADIITPNMWELSYLLGDSTLPKQNLASFIQQSLDLAPHILTTSVHFGNTIGAVFLDNTSAPSAKAHSVSHTRFDAVPNGGGDALAATYLAHILLGKTPIAAMEQAVASIFNIMTAANQLDAGELPLIREQAALVEATPLKSQAISL